MKTHPLLTVIIPVFCSVLSAHSAETTDPSPSDLAHANTGATMSYGNECDKKVEPIQTMLACYRCCVGELTSTSCDLFKNYKNAQNKKVCSCLSTSQK